MEAVLSHIAQGFGAVLTPENLLYCFLGAFIGTMIGVLPGIGPAAAIALLIPLTINLPPTSAIIMVCGIYYGSQYGGSTTSILVNAPGEVSSVVTCFDGYEMAKQGRAKAALATAAIGSFVAGTFATFVMMIIAPPLASLAIKFGGPEYFGLMLLSLAMVSSLSEGSPIKGLIATLFGLLLATVGLDGQTSQGRFMFDRPELFEGIDFIVVVIGLFAVSEVITTAGMFKKTAYERMQVKGKYWISLQELKDSIPAYVRGTVVGFFMGVLPGVGGGLIPSLLSYGIEKNTSKHSEQFGHGAIEGVAGPESANNAGVQGALVPLFCLGIPGSATTAVILGAFIAYGVRPGPMLFDNNPDLVWTVIASMYVGNVILLILNLPLVNIFAKLLDLPGALLYGMILAFCTLGIYTLRESVFDVGEMWVFGIIGYFMRKYGYPVAPIILGLVLGDLLEQNLRRAITLAVGDWTVFFTRPLSLVLIVMAVIMFFAPMIASRFRSARKRTTARPSVEGV